MSNKTSVASHTPTPWQRFGNFRLLDKTGASVCEAFTEEAAEMIFVSVNAHEALVNALGIAEATLDRIEARHGALSTEGTRDVIYKALNLAEGGEK